MSIFTHGRHTFKHVPVQTRPAPPEHTAPLAKAPSIPRPLPVPAPVHGPASMPPLRPAPPPHPRAAWVPAQPPAPGPPAAIPITPGPITPGAILARADEQFTAVCSVRCQRQGCTQSTSRGGTRSFPDLYAAAEADGWRKDHWDAWMCPRCQQKPGYWPANVLAPVTAWAEVALARDAKGAAGDGYQLREAVRHTQTSTLEAVTAE